jgi:hypothetical protein
MQLKDNSGNHLELEDVLEWIPPGWGKIVKSLIEDLFLLGWDGVISQVKEKFGGLRFYVRGASREVYNRIEEAELQSLDTCEKCGEKGLQSSWGGYWISTLCPSHGEERRLEVVAAKK